MFVAYPPCEGCQWLSSGQLSDQQSSPWLCSLVNQTRRQFWRHPETFAGVLSWLADWHVTILKFVEIVNSFFFLMWAKIITIKRTKDLNYFNMCAFNLFNTQVSQFEFHYWNKLTFSRHSILLRCTCMSFLSSCFAVLDSLVMVLLKLLYLKTLHASSFLASRAPVTERPTKIVNSMPFSPVLFPRGRRVHRSSLQRSPLCRVGLGILQARGGGGVGGCHHNLSVLDQGKLPSPRGPFRHHRAELEGRDAPMSGESSPNPEPARRCPQLIQARRHSRPMQAPCQPFKSAMKCPHCPCAPRCPCCPRALQCPLLSGSPKSPHFQSAPKCLGFPSVPRTVIYPIFFLGGYGGI